MPSPLISNACRGSLGMKYSLRSLFTLALLVGLTCAWLSTLRSLALVRSQHMQQLMYAKEELERTKVQLKDLRRGKQADRTRSFWEAELEGSDLEGMKIASDNNAFQRASFRNCKLARSNLKGGVASFQLACFDGANLKEASLSGDFASFQGSTFVGAELTGATLTGGSSSFQRASFEDATLVNAKWIGDFQGANISGAKFQGANLSAVDAIHLTTCYFDRPPTYNSKTIFPIGFSARDQLWQYVE